MSANIIYYISLMEIVNRCFFIFMAIFCEVSVKEAERFHSLTVCPVRGVRLPRFHVVRIRQNQLKNQHRPLSSAQTALNQTPTL